MKALTEEGKRGREREKEERVPYIIIDYHFCRVEEIRGPIIDSALEEGRRSDVLSSFAGKGGGGGRERGSLREKSII